MSLGVVVHAMDMYCSFLEAWSCACRSRKPTGCIADCAGYELPYVIADVPSGGIVTDKEDGVCVEWDLCVERLEICICQRCSKDLLDGVSLIGSVSRSASAKDVVKTFWMV